MNYLVRNTCHNWDPNLRTKMTEVGATSTYFILHMSPNLHFFNCDINVTLCTVSQNSS